MRTLKGLFSKKEVSSGALKGVLIFLAAFCLVGCGAAPSGDNQQSLARDLRGGGENRKNRDIGVKVHFIDVGQGSCALVESAGQFMLIDGGDRKYSSSVVSYLKKQSVSKLDYVIATHYDADHLNGVVGALNVFDVGRVFAPDYETDTKVYESFMAAVAAKRIKVRHPAVGDEYAIGKAKFTILAPNDDYYDDDNDYSIAIRLTYGKNAFIMTGDAEIESEYEMLENGMDLSCDLYLAGHHGSKYSSSQAFMQAMRPKYVVISVGADNSYGHPSDEAMGRFKAMGCEIYRTDRMGDIVAASDGKKITFSVVKGKKGSADADAKVPEGGGGQKYIGNVNSKIYHTPECSSLPYEKNRIYFSTAKEARDAGYDPCGNCNPK